MKLESLDEVYKILTETITVDHNNQVSMELVITDQYGETIRVLFKNNQITNCHVYALRTTTMPFSSAHLTINKSTLVSLPNKELTNILKQFLIPRLQNTPNQFTLANALLLIPL